MKKWFAAIAVAALFLLHSGPPSTYFQTADLLKPSVKITIVSNVGNMNLGSGSGVVVIENATDFYILTNKHVTDADTEIGHFELQDWRDASIGAGYMAAQ